jgi:hypothetical protein
MNTKEAITILKEARNILYRINDEMDFISDRSKGLLNARFVFPGMAINYIDFSLERVEEKFYILKKLTEEK